MADDAKPAQPSDATATETAPVETPAERLPAEEQEQTPAPPAKPPRPQSPFVKTLNNLKEAFPDADDYTLRAVLIAARGRTPVAVQALLSAADADYKPDFVIRDESDTPREESPRRNRQRQIESDEAMARRLASEFQSAHPGGSAARRTSTRGSYESREPRRSGGYSGRYGEERYDAPQRSFIDDDLPEIRDNLAKGFEETRTKVTGWMNTLRKRLEGDEEQVWASEPQAGQRNQRRSPGLYDRDPAEFDEDFQGVSLRDETEHPPPKPARPGKAAVSALGDDDDDVPLAKAAGSTTAAAAVPPPSAKKDDKWEPLKAVPPEPEGDKDPFFIGESDDEDEDEGESAKKSDDKDKPDKEDKGE